MPTDHYADFVSQSYIVPIRSVTIIDDDYPTYDEVLSLQFSDDADRTSKAWRDNPGRIRQVIRRFRERTPPLLVDVHDGTNVNAAQETTLTSHLHQSDLLILDYQLDPTKENDGTLAIDILRRLIANSHFNLVVVYTSHELGNVFYDVLTGLVGISNRFEISDDEASTAQELIEDTEDRIEGFRTRLLRSIGRESYFDCRGTPEKADGKMLRGEPPYAEFKGLCDSAGWKASQCKIVFYYLLSFVQKELSQVMQSEFNPQLHWSTEAPYWIQGGTIFIAFSNKTDDDDLIEELAKALNAWGPEPSRLIFARLRADVHEHGINAQTPVLASKHALALWYLRLLSADENLRHQYVTEMVARHSDQIMGNVLPTVEDFAQRLIRAEGLTEPDGIQLCCKRFRINLGNPNEENRALLEHNAFVCAKSPSGRHLTTGHIFEVYQDFWICLSPACDLVPTQVGKVQSDVFGQWLPFMAVKLHAVARERWRKEPDAISSGRYVFVHRNGSDIACFSFNEHVNSAPHWRLFHAENLGVFRTEDDAVGDLQFNAACTFARDAEVLAPQQGCARIIGQLRYEYALNLLHRLGGSLTRIGLDFLSGAHQ